MTLINHPASDETLGRVASALETANTLTAAQLAGTSGAAIYDAFYAAGVTPENIDDMFVSWWHGADDGQYTKTQLLARWFSLLNSDKTFGTKFYNFGTSQTTQGELCDDSAEIGVTTPSTNTVKGKDPLHQQFAFWTVEVEYEIDANGEIEIKSVAKVDSSFNRGGTNGMVGVAQKTGWLSITNDSVNWWVRYRTAQAPGYVPIAEGVSPVDNKPRAFVVHAKYMGGKGADGKPTSASGLAPLNYSWSHNSQIAEWRKRGANYAGISICDIFFRILMFWLKYAKKGNSGTMEGCTSYNFQYKCAVAETGVTRVLLTEAQAKNLLVGSSVIVGDVGSGTSTDRSVASMYKCAKNVRILSIVSTVVEETTYYAVNLETDTAFDTTTDTYISTMPWWSGSCDDVLGVDGSPTSCTNGKEPFIIQGLESQIGAYAVIADIIDTITVSEDSTTMTINPATVRLAKNIAQSKSANYVDTNKPLTIPKPANWAWHFIGDLAYDKAHPEFTLPSIVDNGANSGNGFKSAVGVPPSGGVFEWLSWSGLHAYSDCGLACADLGDGLGNAYWAFAAGAPGSGANRGEWAG
jgi:hypothetical protein|nr:MAG TPA: hypothetical protein [Bacteriophage sp.]